MVHNAMTLELPFAFRQKVWRWFSAGKSGKQPSGKPAAGSGASRGFKSLVTGIIRRVLCPEPEILWVPFALRKARRGVRRYEIEGVLVTAPPFSAFLGGHG